MTFSSQRPQRIRAQDIDSRRLEVIGRRTTGGDTQGEELRRSTDKYGDE